MKHKVLTELFGGIKTGHLKLFIRFEQEKEHEEAVPKEAVLEGALFWSLVCCWFHYIFDCVYFVMKIFYIIILFSLYLD
jgi:hypothetical protein